MHSLSHYYYELPNNKPYFVTGLVIPDLATHFSKTYNSVIKNHVISDDNEDIKMIHQGILHHYQADKKFHNSELFIKHMALATENFVKAGLKRDRLRLSVIAHLAVEMMIDRQIVLEREQLCYDFYQAVSEVREDVLTVYFKKFGLEDEKKSFFAKFNFFKQRQFIFLFKELENIVFGLNRIYSMVAGIEFSEEEKRKFIVALNNIDPVMRYSWQEILKV